ncbi:MAG: DUF1801 domain-containing protein [Sediminibacterium sp.]|nr:DUF1801 domain-containing protein [Sediminibacterium sp.]
MISKASTVEEYLSQVAPDKQAATEKLRQIVKKNIPKGFQETMGYGMIGYVVPHKLYPKGYHCTPKDPLPFINIAAQKNFIALYHMGLYGDKKLYTWFTTEYANNYKVRIDMGKSCIRFKKPEHIPYDLIAELVRKITPEQWIERYENAFVKK